MRTLIGLFALAATGLALVPSSQELHNLYGEPRVESFSAKPGIDLIAEYGGDRLVCQILIEPTKSLFRDKENGSLMSSESVSEVLEEVVPDAKRGKQTSRALSVSGCNEIYILDYENVSIMRSKHTCDPSSQAQDVRTVITFKRETAQYRSSFVSLARSRQRELLVSGRNILVVKSSDFGQMKKFVEREATKVDEVMAGFAEPGSTK